MSSLQEKSDLLPTVATRKARSPSWSSHLLAFISLAALWGTAHLYAGRSRNHRTPRAINHGDPLCPQTDSLKPIKNADLYRQVGSLVETDDYKQRAIAWLSGAVKIPLV
jgi:hypothetical protein